MTIDYFVPAIGQQDLVSQCEMVVAFNQSSDDSARFVVVDNGSEIPIESYELIRNDENLGMVKTLRQCMDNSSADILIYAHSDFRLREEAWDSRISEQFERDEKLGMVVAMGCRKAERNGGRSGCFCSFDGDVHGKYPSDNGNFVAMVDGCFLAMRRSIMDICGIPDLRFPPHHFYERDWVLEMVTRGYRAKVIPMQCSHLSGRTACQPECQEWFNKHGGEQSIYNEAERMYLAKWGHLLPVHCDDAGNYFTKAGPVFNSENA